MLWQTNAPLRAVTVRESDVRQLREMFPSVPIDEVKRILAINDGNVENSIVALLSNVWADIFIEAMN